MENLSIGSAPTLPSVPRSESAPVAAPQPAPPSAPGDRAQVSSEARGPQRAGASPNLMQGLEESYRLPPRTHNGGPPLDPETVRQGAVPGSTTANPQRGSYQIGSNPNVPPLRSQAAANIVITDPNNPGGARPHTLVSVEQNQEAIRQGRGDPRFAGYEKRSVNIPYENGRPGSPPRGVEIHYQYRPGDQSTADIKDATGSRPQNNSGQRSSSPGILSRAGMLGRVLRGMSPLGMVMDAVRHARDVQVYRDNPDFFQNS